MSNENKSLSVPTRGSIVGTLQIRRVESNERKCQFKDMQRMSDHNFVETNSY